MNNGAREVAIAGDKRQDRFGSKSFSILELMSGKSNRIIITVIGSDTVGIIANVSAVLAEAHANIIDISQTTVREFFAMIMLADLEHATAPFDELKRRLDAKGAEMGLRIDAQHEDVFKFMHRI